jgi:uncharacterized protein YecT (DUF1311 family)
MIIKSTLVVGLFVTLSTAFAAEKELSAEYSACLDKAGGVTFDMIECIAAETGRQDATLNNNYRILMSKLSSDQKKALLEAERAWIAFRDANCQFYGDPQGGTKCSVGRFGEPTIIWMGSIPAPFTGGATSAVVVVDIHPPNAAAIKATEATKANLRMRSSRSVPRQMPRMTD